jgi:hypothetical protein
VALVALEYNLNHYIFNSLFSSGLSAFILGSEKTEYSTQILPPFSVAEHFANVRTLHPPRANARQLVPAVIQLGQILIS